MIHGMWYMWYMIDGICHLEQLERAELGAAVPPRALRDDRPRNGSKNGEMAPRTGTGCPHIGPFVDWRGVLHRERVCVGGPVCGLWFRRGFSAVSGLDEASVLWFVV